MKLAELQSAFAAAVIDGETAFLDQVTEGDGLAPVARLQVYADAYRARLAEALADSYGHTQRYLGEEGLRELALAYVEASVPRHYSLRWYGAGFAAWLVDSCPEDPEVGELAMLDAALRTAFDSADARPLQAADLAAVEDWDRAAFRLHPAFQLLELHHNTVAIWQALEADQAPPHAAALEQPMAVLVWRRGWQPHFRSLAAEEADALAALHGGATFASVCARLADAAGGDDSAAQAGSWLRRWLSEELLVGLA